MCWYRPINITLTLPETPPYRRNILDGDELIRLKARDHELHALRVDAELAQVGDLARVDWVLLHEE